MARRYGHHKYTWSKPFGSVRHHWELIGPQGGLHFHASEYDGRWSCGLEFHSYRNPGDEPPSQVHCWLLKAPCWHDGTSLYADTLWQRIESDARESNHEAIFRCLEREADEYFGRAALSQEEGKQ